MFQRILVPLDGSPMAERAIPVAANLARQTQGTVIFFHILTPATVLKSTLVQPQQASVPVAGGYASNREATRTEAIEEIMAQAASYLATLPTSYASELAGLTTEIEIAFGTTPPTFPSTAHLGKVDLVVLCSHREVGLGQWGLTGAAQQVMRQSPLPLLILNEHAPEMPVLDGTHPMRILVPLDGSLFAETALAPALQLLVQSAGSGSGELCLAHVVDLFTKVGPEGEAHMSPSRVQQSQQSALRYLQAVADHLHRKASGSANLRITCHVTSGMDIVKALVDLQASLAKSEPAVSLIALATHGREGLPRQAMGSVAERLLGATTTPLLTVTALVPSRSNS